ncbi:MAG: hypothetical protein JJT81_18565, partial [Rubellimicrobium sp.]|nr:hypothetical protein [Rubellimicrobium sp.]
MLLSIFGFSGGLVMRRGLDGGPTSMVRAQEGAAMHPKAAIVAFALAGTILGNPALTQEMRAVAPVFAQLVTYPLPQGFVPAHEAAAEGQYIHESIPAGETLQVWSQMMTLTGLQGAGGFPPSDFALMMLQGYESACPESFAASPLGMPEVPGARGGFAVHMS